MRIYWVWLILCPTALWAIWQLYTAHPVIPPLSLGVGLWILGLLGGLRLGVDSATRFTKDLVRLNAYLGQQNQDLAEMNHRLLQEVTKAMSDENAKTSG